MSFRRAGRHLNVVCRCVGYRRWKNPEKYYSLREQGEEPRRGGMKWCDISERPQAECGFWSINSDAEVATGEQAGEMVRDRIVGAVDAEISNMFFPL